MEGLRRLKAAAPRRTPLPSVPLSFAAAAAEFLQNLLQLTAAFVAVAVAATPAGRQAVIARRERRDRPTATQPQKPQLEKKTICGHNIMYQVA